MAEAFILPPATGGATLTTFDADTFEVLQNIQMDATLSEDYTSEVEWTPHPVEDGADITDNASLQLDRATLAGVMTQTPIVGGSATTDRLAEAEEALRRIIKDRLPVLVVTGLRVLEDYVVTSLSVSRSQTTGLSFNFSIDLMEIITVEAQFTEVPPAPVRADKKAEAGAAVDGGTKAPVETTPEAETGSGAGDEGEEEPLKSIAAKSKDLGSATFAALTGGG